MPRQPLLALIATAALFVAGTTVAGQPIFLVNSADDSRVDRCDAAHCSLREAILAANAARGAEIRFSLPAPHRYEPLTPLPTLRGHVSVNGASQPGAECPLPVVHVDGSAVTAPEPVNGLEVLGDGNQVRGLVITSFSGHGIVVNGRQNELSCLFVGVGPTGMEPQGNGGHGIAVIGGHSNRIGSPDPRDANLLSDNGGYGLYIEDALNTHRHNNRIGVDILGAPRLPNADIPAAALNPAPPPSPLPERALARIRALVQGRIATIIEEHGRALEDSRLFEKYRRLLRRDPRGGPVPANLSELIAALVRRPDLYAAFTADAAAVLSDARADAAARTDRLYRSFRGVLPALGRDRTERPEDQQDPLDEELAACAPDDCPTSAEPSDVVAVEGEDLGLSPLRWHSLAAYGPTSFNAQLDNLPLITTCPGHTTPCFWPIAYDFLPSAAALKWETDFTQQEVADIVQQNGHVLHLRVNGLPLKIGPPHSLDPTQGFSAATNPNAPCPVGKHCFVTSVRVRNALRNVPKPWVVELEITKLFQLNAPLPIGIDEFGNLIFATHESKRLAFATRTIQPNQETGSQHWFTAALFPTFQHARCVQCHSLDAPDPLATHHGVDTPDFVVATDLHLEPSAFVPGAHVNACANCHTLPLTDPDGHPFQELEWLTPYLDLLVNWGEMTSPQICARVKTNLPTDQMRHQHFHGDARLFWAIQNPVVPTGILPSAPPHDFGEFLRRVDLWNAFGAPCP